MLERNQIAFCSNDQFPLGLQTLGSGSNSPAVAACLQAERLLRGAFVPSAAGSLHLPLKVDFKNFREQRFRVSWVHTDYWSDTVWQEKKKSLQGSAKHTPLYQEPQQTEMNG